MASFDLRYALLPLVIALVPACAPVQHDVGSDDDAGDSGDSDGKSKSAPGEGGGSANCVGVDLSAYDHSCDKDSDCASVTNGPVCPGYYAYCDQNLGCGGAAISASELSRYMSAIASVTPEPPVYSCPVCSQPQCVQHVCTPCTFDPRTGKTTCDADGGAPDAPDGSSEAAAPGDGGCYFPSLDASCPLSDECTIRSQSLCGGGLLQVTCSATGQGMIESGCTRPDGG